MARRQDLLPVAYSVCNPQNPSAGDLQSFIWLAP